MRSTRRMFILGAGSLAAGGLGSRAAEAQSYRRRYAQPEPKPQALARTPVGPVMVIVSIEAQKLWVYDKDGLIDTTHVSTGTGGYPTPLGVFAVIEKSVRHFSNLYGGAPMPYMQRLTMSGVALHQGVVTGRPASHGCVRLPQAFAPQLYQMTRLGSRVVIMHGEARPADIEHAALFAYKPLQPVRPEEIADPAARARALAADLTRDYERGVMRARIGSITAWRRDELQKLPISVLVSRAEARVFVRHGFSPLFDAPAIINDAEKRIGTHVFTALEPKGSDGEMRWSVVTANNEGAPPAQAEPQRRQRSARRGEAAPEPPPIVTAALSGPPSSAGEALDRIELSQEVRTRISSMLSPGASLIVSDEGQSHEMRVSGTDFVVLTR
ncbi:MAG: L,D-transpeptidase [Hyphomicrobiaceae bacterium]|nr:L,D-transpeptidase [Hyphomicrobiaceae bacterium]